MSLESANKSKSREWIKAMRLRTLPLALASILMGSSLAYYESKIDMMSGDWSWTVFGLTISTTLLLQILSNLANDYGDAAKGADNEGRIGPQRAVQSGIISLKEMRNAVALFSLLSFVSGVFLLLEAFDYVIDWVFLGFITLGLLAIAAAIKYTVGKGAYGYQGAGEVFVLIFFGWVGVTGTIYLQLQYIDITWLLPATTIGLLASAVLNLNNMRDRENDQKVGKVTQAVRMGFTKAKQFHYFLFISAYLMLILYFIYVERFFTLFSFSLPLAVQIIHLFKVSNVQDPSEFDPELKKVALSTFLLALISFILSLYQI